MLFESALVLANRRGKSSVLNWRPFDKTTIDTIIDGHNRRFVEALRDKQHWPENYIDVYAPFVRVENYDLSEVSTMPLKEFPKIKYVFADLEALAAGGMAAARNVAGAMNQAQRVYFLAQLSKKAGQASQADHFRPSPVYVSDPEVIASQSDFEKWLDSLAQITTSIVNEISPPSSPGSSGTGSVSVSASKEFASWSHVFVSQRAKHFASRAIALPQPSLARLALGVRDTAVEKEFNLEQTKALARMAALQEEAVGSIRDSVMSDLKSGSSNELFLDSLRKPLRELTIDDLYQKKTATIKLVTAKLVPPFELPQSHSELFKGVDLSKENLLVLQGSPEVLDTIKGLKGVTVLQDKKEVTLPFDASELLA